MSATRSIRRLADQAVTEALDNAVQKIITTASTRHPRHRAGTVLKAYLRAVRRAGGFTP